MTRLFQTQLGCLIFYLFVYWFNGYKDFFIKKKERVKYQLTDGDNRKKPREASSFDGLISKQLIMEKCSKNH